MPLPKLVVRYFNVQFIQHAISKENYWNTVAGAAIFVQSVRVHKAWCARSKAWWCSWCLTKLASWDRFGIKLDLCNAMVTTELLQGGAVGHYVFATDISWKDLT